MNVPTLNFGETLEAVDQLTVDEQAELVEIVKRRLLAQRRAEFLKSVQQANAEYEAGLCKEMSVDELMTEIRR